MIVFCYDQSTSSLKFLIWIVACIHACIDKCKNIKYKIASMHEWMMLGWRFWAHSSSLAGSSRDREVLQWYKWVYFIQEISHDNRINCKLGMVTHAFYSSAWESEAGESLSLRPVWCMYWIPGQSGPHTETRPCLNKQANKKNELGMNPKLRRKPHWEAVSHIRKHFNLPVLQLEHMPDASQSQPAAPQPVACAPVGKEPGHVDARYVCGVLVQQAWSPVFLVWGPLYRETHERHG